MITERQEKIYKAVRELVDEAIGLNYTNYSDMQTTGAEELRSRCIDSGLTAVRDMLPR